MRVKLYNTLVNKVPGIRSRYQHLRKKVSGAGRIKCWLALFGWNFSYYVLRRRKIFEQSQKESLEKKKWNVSKSESSFSIQKDPQELAQYLAQFDIISFDVFDTLIFRPFDRPADLFFFIGNQLKYPDFERIRKEMEWRAREKKYKEMQCREVTLDDIWTLMERETGISKEVGMQVEIGCEINYCFANPYMQKVIQILKSWNKKIIITSDMYLREVQIRQLLELCGYGKFDNYFVSCEHGKSKGDKGLYELIKNKFGKQLSYVHVGDNEYSDQKKAREAGFVSIPYKNVNDAGKEYRCEDMSIITGSMYRGLVNSYLHNGLREYGKDYELGFVYGGLFAVGYCQFIHQCAEQNKVDKILFLARDGDILQKIYQLMYPEETTEYVYWSRKAATKLTAEHFRYDYFRRFLYHKINQDYTVESIFKSMQLEDLLEAFCRETGYEFSSVLKEGTADCCKNYLLNHWDKVLEHYESESNAGKQYYQKILSGCRKVLAVDVGWAGSGAISLNYLVQQEWKINCEVLGVIAGTNTCHNAEPDTSETFLQTGQLISYFYSQRENRDLWKFHDLNRDHNLYLELLLSSPTPTFSGFSFDADQKVKLWFGDTDVNIDGIKQIQNGIIDFAKAWIRHFAHNRNMARISGRDAYAPLIVMLNHKKYLEEINRMFYLNANVE